jgi:hypothetical protein
MTVKLFAYLLLGAFLLCFWEPASAHGGQPRLEIDAETLSPGSALEIRGVGFEFEEQIALELAGSVIALPLGTIGADTEGGFLLVVSLPPELTAGTYFIRATTDDHEVSSIAFSVQGAASPEEGGEVLRDEDDGLLVPMPTLPPGFTSTPIPAETGPHVEAPSATNERSLIPGVVNGAGFLALIGIRLRLGR